MKKIKLLTIASILLLALSMNAQDLVLTWEGDTLGDVVTVWGEPGANEIVFQAVVHNNTDQWMKTKVRRNQLDMVEGTSSYFCWGICYPDDVLESQDSILIVSGGSSVDTAFSGQYLPNSKIGTSLVEYIFYNQENEDQQVKVLVKYWASPESIDEGMTNGGSISDIYPNPATTVVSIDYSIPPGLNNARISIVNIYGNVVKELEIDRNAHKLTVDISDMESGIYFYTMLIGNNIYETKKLIIQKN
ncbi:MAG: hypothetical protein DRI89_01290 [Bacteroidetes bacterium]|nr:MAG: hypothetical protein DRI89_01290 [Bacteroidota bacterium]